MNRTVTLTQQGREGQVTYTEGLHAMTGYQEFGGADVLAIISMGTAESWHAQHAWAVDQRAQILRYIADEAIRQRAPACSAEIDEASGDILLRIAATTNAPAFVRNAATESADVSWVRRYGALKGKLGVIGLGALLLFGTAMWIKTRVLVVQPGAGTPMGSTVRTDTHLATLISQLQPYTPSLHHDGSTERFTVSVFLVPLDGSPPQLLRLVRDLPPGSYSLARVIGSDGRTIWISVNGLYGVNLRTHDVVTDADVVKANPALPANRLGDTRGMDIVDGRLQIVADDRSATWTLEPTTLEAASVTPRNVHRSLSNPPLTLNMAAGLFMPPDTWLGVQSQADLERAYRPGRWLRAVAGASDTPREARRLVRAALAASSDDDGLLQIRAIAPVGETEFRNASFLRSDEKSEPLLVRYPDSVLMLHTSGDGTGGQGTLLVSRVQAPDGTLLWTVDTGIHRFKLDQILPAGSSTVFIGTRPPIPDKLSEPLIVVLDHATGRLTTHSLWR